MKPILKISTELNNLLPKADELWIACATISEYGLKLIQDKLPVKAKQKILVGVDLPTPPRVLNKLMDLNDSGKIEAKLFFKKEKFYHPKLYVIRTGHKISAIVGSGNCTMGGLQNNLEISVRIDDTESCMKLINYFDIYFRQGEQITDDFIKKYKLIYDGIEARKEEDRKKLKLIRFEKEDFTLEDIDFKNQFFGFEHFVAFEGKKPYSHEPEVNEERHSVWRRLYDLYELIKPIIEKKAWDLHPHHQFENIISSYRHSSWTSESLNSLWLHYGKHEKELKKYKKEFGDNQSSMYHMRIQILIQYDSISYWCRVGKNDGSVVDREYFREEMKKEDYRNKFYMLLQKLDDEYWILIDKDKRPVKGFNSPKDLHDFTKKDNIKHYFIIGKSISPDDERLSKTKIVRTTELEFDKLYPIYEHIRHRF